MVLTTIVTGAYKPTYNWGGHIVQIGTCFLDHSFHPEKHWDWENLEHVYNRGHPPQTQDRQLFATTNPPNPPARAPLLISVQ